MVISPFARSARTSCGLSSRRPSTGTISKALHDVEEARERILVAGLADRSTIAPEPSSAS